MVGEQIFRRVNELVETGKTAKAAFDVVAKEQLMTVSNVQQHYYRFKRRTKQRTAQVEASVRGAAKSAQTSARRTYTAAGLPAQLKVIKKDLTAVSSSVQTLGTDVTKAVTGLVGEVRKDARVKRLERNLTGLISR
jgi:hypothetical protein